MNDILTGMIVVGGIGIVVGATTAVLVVKWALRRREREVNMMRHQMEDPHNTMVLLGFSYTDQQIAEKARQMNMDVRPGVPLTPEQYARAAFALRREGKEGPVEGPEIKKVTLNDQDLARV